MEDRGGAKPASWRLEKGYIDAHGQTQLVPPHSIEAVARALRTRGDETAKSAGEKRVFTLRANQRTLHLPTMEAQLHWELWNGSQRAGSGIADGPSLDLPPALEIGSYQLLIKYGDSTENFLLIVAPSSAYQPDFFNDGRRVWLLAVQLYSIRSKRNWGHGDFTDLAELLKIVETLGASGIGVNPLHALAPGQASPYSPSSRLFLNPLYIDVEAIPEFPGISACGLAVEVAYLKSTEEIDYDRVHVAKVKALKAAYAIFSEKADLNRRASFVDFRRQLGQSLDRLATFEHFREQVGMPWQLWEAGWDNVDDAAEDFEFPAFVQWIASEQLGACRDLAHNLKMPIGLYLDVAVGVDAGGADMWSAQTALTNGLSIGAPPDVYNPAGQDWGLAALHPQALIDSDFTQYREMLRSAMRYAGAIRIDHALGLNRLFLIPSGALAKDGAYVSFPFEAMLAVTAQESAAAQCLVIGEDLGTIPPGVCETLNEWGIWSYRVGMFERDAPETFKQPHHYTAEAIVTFNTHDLPTFQGWSTSHDLKTKQELGMNAGETAQERAIALSAMRNTLVQNGLPSELSFLSVLRYLSRARSKILSVQIEDALGLVEQPNIPGTTNEHPNWKRRLPLNVEEFSSYPAFHHIATVLAQEGRGNFKNN